MSESGAREFSTNVKTLLPSLCGQPSAAAAFDHGLQRGELLRRLGLPKAVEDWSLRSLQVKLIKMGGRIVRHARRIIFQLAEVTVCRDLFAVILERLTRLRLALG